MTQGIGWRWPTSAAAALAVAAGAVLAGSTESPPEPPTSAPVELVAERTVTVTDVTDGDTFDTSDGQTVRVLGLDACESSTERGPEATADARRLLAGQTVTLVEEPGIDLDPFGRQLRYAQLPSGADYGLSVIGAAHTGVYQGENDADPAYLAQLRAADDGRDCG